MGTPGGLSRPQSLKCICGTLRNETSLVVQWLRQHTPNAGGPGLIPSQGTGSHIPQLRPRVVKEIKNFFKEMRINLHLQRPNAKAEAVTDSL